MFFTILVLAAALALECLGSYISVVGLSSNASPIIIFLAISLDFSKVMIATVLYKRWKDIHLLLKSFLIPALLFLMIVTSSGTYAFLLQEFSKTTAGQQQLSTKIELLNTEKTKLEARKKEIDNQIAQLPPSSVLQRKRMTDLFSKELDYINGRVIELDKEIPQSTMAVMQGEGHTGTLGSIAKAYGTSVENINKIIAFFIVLVVDPLAIVLLTVANFLMEQRKKDRRTLLLQKLNGEAPLDDESLIQELKNKVNFLKNKLSKENLSSLNIFSDSKNDVVRKPLMNKDKHFLQISEYILSTNLIENPKVYVPTKYSSIQAKLDEVIFLKESRPIIFKVNPEKSSMILPYFNFIENQSVIPPTTIIKPLAKYNVEDWDFSKTMLNEQTENIIAKNAEKSVESLTTFNFCNYACALEPVVQNLKLTHNGMEKVKELELFKEVKLSLDKQVQHLENSEIIHTIEELNDQDTILEKTGTDNLLITSFINDTSIKEEPRSIILEISNIISEVKLGSTEKLTVEKEEELIEHEFILNSKSLDNIAPTMTPVKKVQKPIPKSLPNLVPVVNANGGFFEEPENKKFIPSNYDEPIIFEEEDRWDEETERPLILKEPESQEELNESDYLALSGFATKTLLKENFTL